MADDIVEVWLDLCRKATLTPGSPVAWRPPSLRDACYAWALSQRTATETDPAMIEAFVNGLELGAISKIRAMMWGSA